MCFRNVSTRPTILKPHRFSEKQLRQFKMWFAAMDDDDSGSVSLAELSRVFLSTGVVKSFTEAEQMFRAADDNDSGALSFDEFLIALSSSIKSEKIQMHRLDAVVEAQNFMSLETVLSEQRRSLLMRYLVSDAEHRYIDMDRAYNRHIRALKKSPSGQFSNKTVHLMTRVHEKQVAETQEAVSYLCHLVEESAQQIYSEPTIDTDVKEIISGPSPPAPYVIPPNPLPLCGSISSLGSSVQLPSASRRRASEPILPVNTPSKVNGKRCSNINKEKKDGEYSPHFTTLSVSPAPKQKVYKHLSKIQKFYYNNLDASQYKSVTSNSISNGLNDSSEKYSPCVHSPDYYLSVKLPELQKPSAGPPSTPITLAMQNLNKSRKGSTPITKKRRTNKKNGRTSDRRKSVT